MFYPPRQNPSPLYTLYIAITAKLPQTDHKGKTAKLL